MAWCVFSGLSSMPRGANVGHDHHLHSLQQYLNRSPGWMDFLARTIPGCRRSAAAPGWTDRWAWRSGSRSAKPMCYRHELTTIIGLSIYLAVLPQWPRFKVLGKDELSTAQPLPHHSCPPSNYCQPSTAHQLFHYQHIISIHFPTMTGWWLITSIFSPNIRDGYQCCWDSLWPPTRYSTL